MVLILTIVVSLVLLTLVPHEKALRYARLTDDFSKAGWIFHRTHTDDRQIDAAFIGTSHTMAAVDDRHIEDWIGRHRDRVPAVVNFALPHHGRNLQYALSKDLFDGKRPRLLILEIRETEARFGHPMFSLVADTSDVLLPVYVINRNGFSDIASLPLRQASLFIETRLSRSGLDVLDEPSWTPDYVQGRTGKTMDAAALNEASDDYKAKKQWNVLGRQLDWLEYRYPRQYLMKIIELAKASNCELAFLYLPFYGADPAHRDENWYRRYGEMWYPPQSVLSDTRNWSDVTHLNERGSQQLTPWLARKVAAHLSPPSSTRSANAARSRDPGV